MYEQGINFRATEAYRVDIAPDTYEIGVTANYPRTTPQGNTVGWEVGPAGGTRNRSTTPIARLGGIHFMPNTTGAEGVYRLDVPVGWYEVRVALGDIGYTSLTNIEIFDDQNSLGRLINNITTPSSNFADASGAVYTWGNWPTQNTPVYVHVSSGILRFKIGGGGPSANCSVAHLYAKHISNTAINSPDGWKPAISRYIN